MKRILVVDDELVVRDAIKEALTRFGYKVETASDGFEALEKLFLAHHDLVITDVVMPEMDGIKLIEHIRQIYPHLQVIAVSGGGGSPDKAPEWLEKAHKAGAAKMLIKPFKPDVITQTASELLGMTSAFG